MPEHVLEVGVHGVVELEFVVRVHPFSVKVRTDGYRPRIAHGGELETIVIEGAVCFFHASPQIGLRACARIRDSTNLGLLPGVFLEYEQTLVLIAHRRMEARV